MSGQYRNNDLRAAFQPLTDLVSGEGKNPDEVHFPSLSPEEYAQVADKYMDDLEQNYTVEFVEDEEGIYHPVFIRKEDK